MKRSFSPLVWICCLCASMLAMLTTIDPGGVYAEYISELNADTPSIAAIFIAAQNGVYPWSHAEPAQAPASVSSDSAYQLLNNTVTESEMRASVGNNDPFPESLVTEEPAEESPAPETEEEPDTDIGFVTVDRSWFDDALFIGDSHTEGFYDYAGLDNATYYFKRGLDVWTVLEKAVVNDTLTIPQALANQQFGKIYILLGINEIGIGTTEDFAEQYGNVVAQLREMQPDALIYIQSIFHTTKHKSDTSIYNNDTINARNQAISALADGEHVFYVDNNPIFDNENGTLKTEYTGDGVHVKAPYYKLWLDNLCLFGRA